MSTSTYKGKDVFVDTASSDYVSMGGRDSEMTFGLGRVLYSNLYLHDYEKFHDEHTTVIVDALGGEEVLPVLLSTLPSQTLTIKYSMPRSILPS